MGKIITSDLSLNWKMCLLPKGRNPKGLVLNSGIASRFYLTVQSDTFGSLCCNSFLASVEARMRR